MYAPNVSMPDWSCHCAATNTCSWNCSPTLGRSTSVSIPWLCNIEAFPMPAAELNRSADENHRKTHPRAREAAGSEPCLQRG